MQIRIVAPAVLSAGRGSLQDIKGSPDGRPLPRTESADIVGGTKVQCAGEEKYSEFEADEPAEQGPSGAEW